MASASCHYCNRPAEEECSTCGRLYCLEHGEDVCLRCLAPEAATPSGNVYRGSLLALVAASLVALFLWFSPPASKNEQDTAQRGHGDAPRSSRRRRPAAGRDAVGRLAGGRRGRPPPRPPVPQASPRAHDGRHEELHRPAGRHARHRREPGVTLAALQSANPG
jgi:hypothetical protein